VHRHRLPLSPSVICASVGWGCFWSRLTVAITMPGVQKPHCKAWHLENAACTGWSAPGDAGAKPSIVVMWLPCAWAANMVQDFTAWPSSNTVQHPHWLVSHPTCVPVRPKWSLSRSTSKVRSSASAARTCPLMCKEMFMVWVNRFRSGF